MIVDNSYFTGKLNIPNLSDNQDYINNNDKLDNAIKEYEFIYLKSILGFEVAKDVLDKVQADGQVTGGQKYKDLIEGEGEWKGLRYEVNGVKYSQIANYVYCQYLLENQTELTEAGNTIATFEKGNVISSWSKYNRAWQDMMLERQLHYVYDLSYYNYNVNNRGFITLWEYLSNSDDWDINHFQYWENTNKLGI